jgi:hypothetical protein
MRVKKLFPARGFSSFAGTKEHEKHFNRNRLSTLNLFWVPHCIKQELHKNKDFEKTFCFYFKSIGICDVLHVSGHLFFLKFLSKKQFPWMISFRPAFIVWGINNNTIINKQL